MSIPALFAKQDKTRRSSFRRRTLFGTGKISRHLHRRQLLLEPLEERALLAVALSGVPAWLAQGPSPAINGQTENIASTGPGANPVSGAIHQVVAHPTDADLLYIGAVNGGVWRTTDATAANPAWEPLTDQFPGLSIGTLQFDPTDATNNTLYAGIGRFSAFGREGGPLTGLLRTTDGGDTWEQVGAADLAGRSISGVGARGDMILASANAFGGGVGAGMYRSTDDGATFDFISGINGLDAGPVFYLADDPLDGDRFYASVGGVGLFRTDDAGANWVDVSQNDATLQGRIQAPGNNNTEMSVSPISGRVYVGVLQNGVPNYIGFSDNQGATWTEMDLPISLESAVGLTNATNATPIVITSNGHGLINGNQVRITGVTGNTAANGDFFITRIDANNFSLNGSAGNGNYAGGGTWQALSSLSPREKPGGQGAVHFSILADPTAANIVYVGGDRQDTPFPNAIGATDFTGRLFRGDTSVAAVAPGSTSNQFSPQWQHLTHTQNLGFAGGGTINNSSPHADSRDMVFNALGDLIEVDDGGIYRRTSPQDNTGGWFSLLSNAAGGLQVTEMHDVVYDPVSGIIISGNQDTGTTEQIVSGGLEWRSVTTADGGDVVVDILGAAPDSIRYSSTQNLGGFRYRVMDAANNQVGATVSPALNTGADPAITPQFVTPLATNNVVGDRLIIGGANGAYESTDRGENLTQVSTTIVNRNAIDYGGRRDGVDNADVLYVGSDSQVLARTATTFGALAATAALPAGVGTIVDVLMHTEDWMTAFAIDNDQVFHTTNAGAAWNDITGNLVDFNLRSLEFVFDAIAGVGALLAGGDGGVYRSLTTSLGTWTELGAGLPNAPVWDMDYDPIDDVLVAGTLGRGAWLIENASVVVMNPGVLTICGDQDYVNQDDVFRLVRNDANPLILDVYVNSGVPVFSAPLATIQQINVFGVGGNDTLIVDSSNGLINVPGGIRYNGDGACDEGFGFGYDRGFDTLVLHQDGGPTHVSSSYLVGPGIGSGTSVIQGGGGPGDVQTVFFEELEPFIDLVPAVAHTLTATPEDNAINYSAGPNTGLVNLLNPAGLLTGLVTVDNYEGYEFANKTELIINAGAGDDVVNLNNLLVPAGLALIIVNGGDGSDHVTTSEGVAADVQFFGGAGHDRLDASGVQPGFTALLDGGAGNDVLIGGPGDDTLVGGPGDDTLVSSSGNDNYNGGTGFNTLLVLGTPGNDRIDAHQSAANTLVLDVNGDVRNETVSNVQEVRIEAGAGNDIMRVRVADALVANPAASLRFHVVGGPPATGDRLAVIDDGLGDLVIHRQGADDRSGSITVGPLAPVIYEEVEFVQVAPLNPITGGTGTDGAGRLLVFKPDPFESNNSLPNATFLGSGAINVDAVIDPGADIPFGMPGDEDWYRIVAEVTGTLDIQVYFTVIEKLGNDRAGLPGNGDLDIALYDADGLVNGLAAPIAGTGAFGTNDATNDERIRIPAVAGQTYYLRVVGALLPDADAENQSGAINSYNLSVVNHAPPVPFDLELNDLLALSEVVAAPAPTATTFSGEAHLSAVDNFYTGKFGTFTAGPLVGQQAEIIAYAGATRTFTVAPGTLSGAPGVGDTFQVESHDTGRSQFDNVTRDNTPTIWFRLDDAIFEHDLPGNPAPGNPLPDVVPIPILFNPEQTDVPTQAGFRVAVFVEGLPQQPGQLPQVPVGFARQLDEGVYEFDFETDALAAPFVLSDGSHFISARVQMIDPADNDDDDATLTRATGFGPRSTSLEIIVDTTLPPVFFGFANDPTDGLVPDPGVTPQPPLFVDNKTADRSPSFWGTAEANAIVRVYADLTPGNGVDNFDVLLGMTVALPFDGTNQYPNGQWRVSSNIDLNDPAFFPLDGLRRILVTAEDLAGNVNPGPGLEAQALEIFLDTQGPQVFGVFFPRDTQLVGVTGAGNTLLRFHASDPATILASLPVTGLVSPATETIVGIDVRPADNLMYAVTSNTAGADRLYVVHPSTGVAVYVDDISVALSGTSFGVDFDPVADRLRVVSDTDQNLSVDPVTGVAVADAVLNPGPFDVGAAAYTNSTLGTLTTALYVIDTFADTLFLQNPAASGTLTPVGGPLGVNAALLAGFDITPELNVAYAALTVAGITQLYTINLVTGAATLVGDIGGNPTLGGLTALPPYDVFDPKPSTDGPTPLVHDLSIRVQDLPARVLPFDNPAVNPQVAVHPGHFQVIGDANGHIAIQTVTFLPDPFVPGQPASGTLLLTFVNPLPDDRFTLIMSDSIVDDVGNALDGESNAAEPQENPLFPSGDGQPGGNFVARFTVDSRAEIGVWAAGSVYIDTNGNFVHDPHGKDGDFTNRDITYMFGLASDNILAGNFADPGTQADGFHKLAAYGRYGGANRWLIDTDNNGVPNWNLPDGLSIDGLPLAGRFWDGVVRNNINIDPDSDQVGVKKGTTWYLDTNANLIIDAGDVVLAGNMPGMPIAGDFDGDGIDDLGSWVDDVFYVNLSTMLTGAPNPASYHPNINGIWDVKFDFGFTGVRERPFAADFDGDGFDDIGLWVPDRSGATPVELAEWYILISGDAPLVNRIETSKVTGRPTIHFTPRPFGNDIYAQFGDNFALPVVGNFDPPVVPFSGNAGGPLTDTNLDNPLDVNADGMVSPMDALVVINTINAIEHYVAQGAFKFSNGIYPDVNGDSWVTPWDVLLLVNHLNRALVDGEAGEGESSDLSPMLGLVDQPLTVAALPEATGAWSPAAPRSAEGATGSAADPADGFVDPEAGPVADVLFAELGKERRSGGGELEDDPEDLLSDIASEVDRWWKTAV